MRTTSHRGTVSVRKAAAVVLLAAIAPSGCVALGAATAHDGSQRCTAPQPLKNLPPGWLHVPIRIADQWTGGFHDADSGAFVYYRVGKPDRERAKMLALPSDAVEHGDLGGYHFTARSGADARRRYEALYAEPSDGSVEIAQLTGQLLPPPMARLLFVAFDVGSQEWAFEVAANGDDQMARARALLLEELRLWTEPRPCDAERHGDGGITPTQYDAIQPGSSAAMLLDSLGPAQSARGADSDGLVLNYMLEIGDRVLGSGQLIFDRAQHLVRKQRDGDTQGASTPRQ